MNNPLSEWPASGAFLPLGAPLASASMSIAHGHRYVLSDVMPELPAQLRNWVHAISCELEVDRGLALSTLLSGMASAVQGTRMVRLPRGGDEPLAYFSIILAGPTTGKTRTYRVVHKVHEAHDIIRYQSYVESRRTPTASNPRTPDEAPHTRPAAVRLRPIILQDTSKRGLLEVLEGVGESTAISVDEGDRVLETELFRGQLATLNSLHDGTGKVMMRRGKHDVIAAHNASFTVLVMVQPDAFEAYFLKCGAARGNGFLARCLITTLPAFPEWIPFPMQAPEGCLETYYAKASTFLDARLVQLESGCNEVEAIHFSPGAAHLWSHLATEQHHLTAAQYRHVQDAANRSMQNVARIAGIIHCYCDEGDDISVESLRAAWAIVQWSLGQFARTFPPKALPPAPVAKPTPRQKRQQREIDDCQTILDCIAEACARNQEPDALRSKVLIRSGLYNARFRTALMRLVDEGVVLESDNGRGARLSILPFSQHPVPAPHFDQHRL